MSTHARTVEDLKRAAVNGVEVMLRYAVAVGREIGEEKALKLLIDIFNEDHIKWAKENRSKLNIKGDDCIAAAAFTEAFLRETGTYTFGPLIPSPPAEGELAIVESTPQRVVVHDAIWCPLLEAARNLGFKPGYFCEKFAFPEWENVLKAVINPKVTLKLAKARPQCEYCEEVYEIEK
ncbi:MAG: hypothetical protein ACE5PO_05075 [Candidatus Bathyarchaeia archaeon]